MNYIMKFTFLRGFICIIDLWFDSNITSIISIDIINNVGSVSWNDGGCLTGNDMCCNIWCG